jgi:hypothetical protein
VTDLCCLQPSRANPAAARSILRVARIESGCREEEPERVEPRPDTLRGWGRIAPSFRYYGDYKHFSVLGEYPQSCISIHRCYKL